MIFATSGSSSAVVRASASRWKSYSCRSSSVLIPCTISVSLLMISKMWRGDAPMQSLLVHINRLPARRAVQPRIINRRFRARRPLVVQYAPAEVVAARTRRHAFLYETSISLGSGGGCEVGKDARRAGHACSSRSGFRRLRGRAADRGLTGRRRRVRRRLCRLESARLSVRGGRRPIHTLEMMRMVKGKIRTSDQPRTRFQAVMSSSLRNDWLSPNSLRLSILPCANRFASCRDYQHHCQRINI